VLPDQERLRKTTVFQRVYANKKSASSPLLTLHVLERQPRSTPRLPLVGFVIGKKIEAKASQRNRAKRRVREAYRHFRKNLATGSGGPESANVTRALKQWYAVVWVLKSEVLNATFEEIQSSVSECIQKASEKYSRKPVRER